MASGRSILRRTLLHEHHETKAGALVACFFGIHPEYRFRYGHSPRGDQQTVSH